MSAIAESHENKQQSSISRPEEWIEILTEQVRSLRYGTIQIKVHDSQVVLIECTQRVRFSVESSNKSEP